jgi:hypothetical protein
VSLEFKWPGKSNSRRHQTYEPVEIGSSFRVVLEDKRSRRKLITNGTSAFEILKRGKLYDRLLAEHEFKHRSKVPAITVSIKPLRETIVSEEIKPEPVKQVAVADVPPPAIDEQAEAEQFIKAVTPFIPNPHEWLWASVHKWNVDKQLLIVALSNGETVSCIPKLIVDSPGAHKACLAPKTTGSVRVELVRGKYRCIEAVFEGETANEEIGRIVKWDTDHRRGWVTRPCGDWIYVVDDSPGHGRFENTQEYIVGEADWISFQLVRSEKNDRFIGVKVRKIEAPTAQGDK